MTPYPFTKLSDLSFEFTAGNAIVYKAYFVGGDSLFPNNPEFSKDIYYFNLEVVYGNIYHQAMDLQITETIVTIFRKFFTFRHNVIVYICDTIGNRHYTRKRKFDLWFWKYNDGTILKEDGLAMISDMPVYNSMLVRKQNKYLNKIIDAFRDLNERMNDK